MYIGRGRTMLLCKMCGQPIHNVRFGVRLTPIKARMFDIIALTGAEGCTVERINKTIWNGSSNRENIKSHVYQINDAFEGTPYKIVPTDPRYGYRLRTFAPRSSSREASPRETGRTLR